MHGSQSHFESFAPLLSYVCFVSMSDFLSALENRVLVCDGAMGTMLYSKGIFISRCFDELNLSNPQLVREVHADYIKAGVDIIETNTFGANRTKLMSHGLAEQMREINIQGARIAREAADASAPPRSSWLARLARSEFESSRGARCRLTRQELSFESKRKR